MFGVGECEFNSGVDSINECHQGFKLRENVINETFPKVDKMEES